MKISKHLVPSINRADFLPMLGIAFVGAIIAGIYGIAHDQITYSIGPEYFTKFKFVQFSYADFGLSNRYFVSCIGFLATWWVGFVIAWFLARRLIPGQARSTAIRQIAIGFAIVFASGIFFGALGFAYGIWRGPTGDYDAWLFATRDLRLTEIWPFVRVAYIHNGSYLGGLVGLIAALWFVRPSTR